MRIWKVATLVTVFGVKGLCAWCEALEDDAFSVTLADGSRIIGVVKLDNVKVETPYGTLTVPLADVMMIEFGEQETEDRLVAARMAIVGQVAIKELALTNKHLGNVRLAREHIVRIERGTGARGFAGTWTGEAVDKPGEGGSKRSLVLELTLSATGQLEGVASGEFAKDERAELESLEIKANWLQFEIESETGRFRVRLELKDGKLQGEGMPFDVEEDACDITLEPNDAKPRGRLWDASDAPLTSSS